MSRHKNLATIRKLRVLEQRRARLLEALGDDEPFLVGSLSLVQRTCGKPTCHCATTPAHPAWVLATTRDARRRCQVVRWADVEDVRRRVALYKSFKTALRDLDAIDREQRALLRGLMAGRNVPYD
ncbi:MAG: DUF6788 family protein [candidate division NC10 bacterium]